MDKISIIIPVYNGEKYLARCVESLISQTYKNLEIIFLNDGSTDDSLNILKKYKTKDNRIVIVDKKNTGVSDTRNIGITRATGKYICFCDCDDLYATNYVETMHKTAKKYNADIVKCNYQVIDTSNKLIEAGHDLVIANKKYDHKSIVKNIIPKCLDGSIPCFSYLIMIKKDTITAKYPLDIAMMEDVIFYLRLLMNCKSMYVINDTLYTIMYNPDGATNSVKNTERNIKNVIKVNTYIKDILKENSLYNEKLSLHTNLNTLNAVSDFIFKHYLYSKENTINIAKNIRNDDYLNIVSETDLKLINLQRRTILKLIKNKHYLILKIFMFFRKLIFKLRRR